MTLHLYSMGLSLGLITKAILLGLLPLLGDRHGVFLTAGSHWYFKSWHVCGYLKSSHLKRGLMCCEAEFAWRMRGSELLPATQILHLSAANTPFSRSFHTDLRPPPPAIHLCTEENLEPRARGTAAAWCDWCSRVAPSSRTNTLYLTHVFVSMLPKDFFLFT